MVRGLNTEAVVYIARKLHWSRAEIGQLSPSQFIETYNEVVYQESVDDYKKLYSVAVILAAISNTIPRKRGSRPSQASDFLKGRMPERNIIPQTPLDKMAKDIGIKLPKEQ